MVVILYLNNILGIYFLNDSYITEVCSHGFQCLYNNTDGTIESMGDFCRLEASNFK
jgi:hypothetical protein